MSRLARLASIWAHQLRRVGKAPAHRVQSRSGDVLVPDGSIPSGHGSRGARASSSATSTSPLRGWPLGGLGLLLLLGCSHYRLGTEGELAFRTLYVAPVENAAPVPQASALLGTQLREALLRDARVRLVNDPAEAEATLSVRLVRYDRTVATVRPDDTGLARKLELNLAAVCTLRDNRTGTLLFSERPLDSRRQAFTDSGQLQAEYQTLPLLATALAQNVARAVLDTW